MKKAYLFLFIALFTLVGCKFIAKEIKQSNQIRKIAKEACDCKYVGVSKNYDNGNATLTLTIKRTNSNDFGVIADSIMGNLQAKYEKTCGFGEIFILFETDSLTERYTFYGCEPGADHDSFNPNELMSLKNGERKRILRCMNQFKLVQRITIFQKESVIHYR